MTGLITSIFAHIDMGIYFLVTKLFNLIFYIADVNIFKDTAIQGFTTRVYVILGVVILFKIIISCVQYLINPDQMSDKEKGFGSLIQKTIISIALLALVPTIFKFAKGFQREIASAIPAIILNANIQTGGVDTVYNEQVGYFMSFTVLTSFIEAKENVNVSDAPISNFNSFKDNIVSGCGWSGFESSCKYNYQWYFSIPCGIFMLYILLSMGLDVAIRTIKLGLLEILAPIPIASYIDNKKSFDKWKDLSIKVYLDLFVRLIVIYIVIYVINIIASGEISFGSAPTGYQPFIVIYIILALLMFAKSAPKFICDILGIDSKGEGIGEMFKPAWSRVNKSPAGDLFGTARAIANTAESNWRTQKGRFQGQGKWNTTGARLRALGSAIAGGTSAARHGLSTVGQGKGWRNVMESANQAVVAKRDKKIDLEDNVLNTNVPKYIQDENGNRVLNPEYYDRSMARKDKRLAQIGVMSSSKINEMQSKGITEARGSIDAIHAHALKKEEDYKGVVRTTRKEGEFGYFTNGDGEVVAANNISLAMARRMASIKEGEYYDDGKTQERKLRILNQANISLRDAQSAYTSALGKLKSSPETVEYQVEVEKCKANFERCQQQLFDLKNDVNLGKARATAETGAEWDAIVRVYEKNTRTPVFAELLKSRDPDAIVKLEKQIQDVVALSTNSAAKKRFADDFGGIEKLLSELRNKGVNSKGQEVYDVSPEVLDKLKKALEDLQGESNREGMLAQQRAERVAKVQKNSDK